jgi:hypothetical protein
MNETREERQALLDLVEQQTAKLRELKQELGDAKSSGVYDYAFEEENKRLVTERDRLRSEKRAWERAACRWHMWHDDLADCLRTAREALEKYGRHQPLCSLVGGYDGVPCTYGLDDALRDLDAVPDPVTPSDDSASVGVRLPKPDKAAQDASCPGCAAARPTVVAARAVSDVWEGDTSDDYHAHLSKAVNDLADVMLRDEDALAQMEGGQHGTQ